MDILINTKSSEPVYLQIVNQIRAAVQSGALLPGHSLPPVRQLAGDLMINPNTVAKAYKILEQNRIVRGAGRQGTFIADEAAVRIENGNHEDAQHELEELISSLRKRGLTAAQLKLILLDQIEKISVKSDDQDARQISFKGEGFSTRIPKFFTRKQRNSKTR